MVLGALGRKYTRCRTSKYYYVPIEQPLFKLLKKVKTTYAVYATTIHAIDNQGEINKCEACAYDLTNKLINGLKTLNNNYNKTKGDCITGYKCCASSSNTTSSDPIVITKL